MGVREFFEKMQQGVRGAREKMMEVSQKFQGGRPQERDLFQRDNRVLRRDPLFGGGEVWIGQRWRRSRKKKTKKKDKKKKGWGKSIFR